MAMNKLTEEQLQICASSGAVNGIIIQDAPEISCSSIEGFGFVDHDYLENVEAFLHNSTDNTNAGGIEPEISDQCYNGPVIIASTMANHYPNLQDRENLAIINVGTEGGTTGEVELELAKFGFTNVDSIQIEPSTGLLIASPLNQRKVKIFNKPTDAFMGTTQIFGIQDDMYDALVFCCAGGAMEQGLDRSIPLETFHKMVRMIKPTGHIFMVRGEIEGLTSNIVVDKLERKIIKMKKFGFWEIIHRHVVPNVTFGQPGIVYIFQESVMTHEIQT